MPSALRDDTAGPAPGAPRTEAQAAGFDDAFVKRLVTSRRIIMLAGAWFALFVIVSDVLPLAFGLYYQHVLSAMEAVSLVILASITVFFARQVRGFSTVIRPMLLGLVLFAVGNGLLIIASYPPLVSPLNSATVHALYVAVAHLLRGCGGVALAAGLLLGIVQLVVERQRAEQERRRLSHEVNERVRIEHELRAGEERYRFLVEMLSEGIWTIDKDEKTTFVNARMAEMLGYTVAAMMGRRLFDFLDASGIARAKQYLARRREGIREQHDFEFVRSDGSRMVAMIDTAPILDADGRYNGAIAGVVDITDRKRAELERVLLAAGIEQAAEAVIITDVSGKIEYVNPAFMRISGYTREEAIGRTPMLLSSGTHDEAFYEAMWRDLDAGKVWQGRVTNKRKNGELYEEDVTISPVRNEAGETSHYVSLQRDVTKEVTLERQFRQAQKMEAIGTLAGGIAHDMNNVLSLILCHCELGLEQAPKEDVSRAHLVGIERAARRASDLVAHILTFSRRDEPYLRPVAVAPMIGETLRFLRLSLPPNIRIRQHIECEDAWVLAEPTQLHQIVMNLCTNAYHAMRQEGGLIEVTVDAPRIETPFVGDVGVLDLGDYVRLRVHDTGHGMDTDAVQHIFEPFYTTKQPGEGTGLGLPTVHGIVMNCRGAITVQTAPGMGAEFSVYLPRVEGEFSKRGERTAPPEGQYESVLVVDDDQRLAEVAAEVLRSLHYRVEVETHSPRALERFLAA
ncbi:MAG TPA: PAS domain S-box protein, partial [Candidatus Hydrogenedentes bacterium]|nr:PAS domain S-box protein [Candidatus Hydrogenedentota bacterium]